MTTTAERAIRRRPCRKCDYPLELPENGARTRCPECGSRWTLQDLTTAPMPSPSEQAYYRLCIAAVHVVAGVALLVMVLLVASLLFIAVVG